MSPLLASDSTLTAVYSSKRVHRATNTAAGERADPRRSRGGADRRTGADFGDPERAESPFAGGRGPASGEQGGARALGARLERQERGLRDRLAKQLAEELFLDDSVRAGSDSLHG